MNWFKRMLCSCENTKTTQRCISVNVKKNKPPEILWEMKKFCLDCKKILSEAYFTDAQVNRV
jgi:hypothetical protein